MPSAVPRGDDHRALPPPRPRSLRARFARVFGVLLALAALDAAAFYWGARQRGRVFRELRDTIARHAALTETRAGLDDHAKRIRVVVQLVGVEHAPIDPDERRRALQSVAALRHRADRATGGVPGLATVRAETDSLADAWSRFYDRQGIDPADAILVAVTRAEPLAQRLLGTDLPAAIRGEQRRVAEASAAFERADRATSAIAWAVLALSVGVSVALAYLLSRDLRGAIGALHTGVERLGAGDLAHRVDVTTCEELATVGRSLNTMAQRLRQARQELERRNQELAHLAFRDPLTNLANRTLFREHVERALAGRHGHADEMSILFIDLDDFKSINDTLGHHSGDRLLVDVATRLLEATRGSDTVARLGGDEFAILLHRVRERAEAISVAERVLWALRAPFELDGRTLHVSASIGVVFHHDGQSTEELLRNADVAMYRAKAEGKGQHAVFAPEMHAALLDRVELAAELRDALQREALSVVYQPIVDLVDRRVAGFEALVRWPHSRRGPVSPTLFIPLAEEVGAIVPLGRWVIGRACHEAARWQRERNGRGPVGVSINVSGLQLADPAFVRDVRTALDESGLDPGILTLEITETVIMRDSVSTLARLRELKSLGVRVAIDDFGTGYSSLAYLQRFPVDVLKIDKAFVDQIADGGNDAALARTIVPLGDMLQLHTVAEGIERADQHAELLAAGCRLGQGYFFSHPLDADAAGEFLRAD
ncbi:diguanylate cyclase [Gemmatirosa kalamazoonensis]|uniref:Diguanylate cyclase n=1 Tax=Gemmatirosa kalamazoonensis TaxID=861299 RepID=W0RCD6_9BACT|nr:EAL domain-containing protein [Gemmatirosa kalamazoonensis]AHG88456.1 diguanylate cyclase [Gemmatirosa kalamazoonensis]